MKVKAAGGTLIVKSPVRRKHPVFEKGATAEERGDWAEARYYASVLVRYAKAVEGYLAGTAGDPTAAQGALMTALHVALAFDRALARRHTRLNYGAKKRSG